MTDVPTLKKIILPTVLPSMVEAETFSDHPHTMQIGAFHTRVCKG
jgi:hypothetical protein